MRLAASLLLMLIVCCWVIVAQSRMQSNGTASPAYLSSAEESEKANIHAYIDLLRSNVRQEKAEIMGAVIQLDADQAAKFWPIYGEYDSELKRLNDLRRDNIQEYARSYTEMTDEKADQLIKRGMDYQQQRAELLAKYYDRVKVAIGAINAARFVQIEHQLLLIIDLQIASSLPVVGQQ